MKTKIAAPALPKSIVILGNRWFDRVNGNTYNTAEIIVDGVTVHKTLRQYGYGDHYLTLAEEWLDSSGIVPARPKHANGSHTPGWQCWRDDLGIAYTYRASDVQRKRDL